MKRITTDINTKWAMNYRAYKMAKGKRKDVIRQHLFELLQWNGIVVKFNKNNNY